MSSIRFSCASCGKELKAAVEHAGVKVKCPACGTVQNVPEGIFEAEAVPAPAPEGAAYGITPMPPPAETEDRRPCPACGEMIKASAVKCRFCGEIFDERLAKAERKRTSNEDTDLTAVDWVLAIFCSGIGCIMGIVYLIQGKPKGGKMLAISVLFSILGGILNVILQNAARH